MNETPSAKNSNTEYNHAWDNMDVKTADDFAKKVAAFNQARAAAVEKPAPVENNAPAKKTAPVEKPAPAKAAKPAPIEKALAPVEKPAKAEPTPVTKPSSDEMHEIFPEDFQDSANHTTPVTIDVDPSEIRPLKEPQKEPKKDETEDIDDLEDAIIKETQNQIIREEEIQRSKEEELQRAKEIELIQNKQKLAEINKRIADMEAKHPEFQDSNYRPPEPINDDPLFAINMDWTHDKRELAHDLAEQDLNKELDSAKGAKGIAKRIWKGTLFKEYFTEKYQNQYMEGKRKDEQGRTITDLIREQKNAVLERFTLGITENDRRFVHEKAGEKLIPADEKTNEDVKNAIMDYARRKVDLGENLEDLNRDFKDNMARIMQEAIDDGRMEKGAKYTNYLETAKKAAERYQNIMIQGREKIEHDAAMSQVMAGFQVYNAEIRNGVRTEAHRNNIDKIVDKLGKSKLGNLVSSEILYGAVGTVAALTQTGARAVLGAAGGILASSAISGLKERNRITADRVRMMRDIANGVDYGSENAKTAKYEKRIGDTLYDTRKASDLIANLENALHPESGQPDRKAVLRAIAEARIRIDYSDANQKDLISYTSADKRGKERLDLDIALIRAEKSLSKEDKETLKSIKNVIRDDIIEGYIDDSGEYHLGVEEKDEDFKKMRAFAAMKKAGKTLAIGTAVFFGSQEVMAALDPNKIGIFEKAGLIKTENTANAKETILASGFGKARGTYEANLKPEQDIHGNISDPNEIAKYENAGYQKIETSSAWSQTESRLEEIDPSASSNRINVKYDGWAGNGTKFADGNEIRGHLVDGKFVSNMRGTSTYANGSIDYDTSNIKAFLTIGDSKFEIAGSVNEAGQMTWGDNGVFTTTTGETIKAIGDNGERLYKYFEIAADQGIDGEGIQHIIPLATDVGSNTFSGKITQMVETAIEQPATYTFVKSIPRTETFIREVTTNGIAIAPPDLLRSNLGEARQTAQEEPGTPPETAPEAPEATPAPVEPDNTANAPETVSEASTEGSEATSSPEQERWELAILDEIQNNRDTLRSSNGIDGVDILTDPIGLRDVAASERYGEWWNGLSEEGKNTVRDIINRINSSNYRYGLNWGNGINTWLTLNQAV